MPTLVQKIPQFFIPTALLIEALNVGDIGPDPNGEACLIESIRKGRTQDGRPFAEIRVAAAGGSRMVRLEADRLFLSTRLQRQYTAEQLQVEEARRLRTRADHLRDQILQVRKEAAKLEEDWTLLQSYEGIYLPRASKLITPQTLIVGSARFESRGRMPAFEWGNK